MRFTKASLVAAAFGIAASSALLADVVNNNHLTSVNGDYITDLSGRGVITVDTPTLTLEINHATTFNGVILDYIDTSSGIAVPSQSNLVKTGNGLLQYNGFKHFTASGIGPDGFDVTGDQSSRNGHYSDFYYRNHTSVDAMASVRTLTSLGALSGSIIVEAGTLQVSGYINQWIDWTSGSIQEDPEMVGASTTVLNGNAKLSFQNSDLNIVNAKPNFAHDDNGPFVPLTKRLNFVKNLQTGVEIQSGIYSNDQLQTELLVGENASGTSQYRIVAHIEDINAGTALNGGLDGSVGIIRGNQGSRFYKTGTGDFAILNKAEFGGDVFLAGGNTILKNTDSAEGRTLAEVGSVNLVGSDGRQGNYTTAQGAIHYDNGVPFYRYRGGYAPGQESDLAAAQLTLEGNQTIKNLQVLFSEGAAATDAGLTVSSAIKNAAENGYADEIFIAGTGKGTNLNIGAHTLTIDQQFNGYYAGNINADSATAEGTLIKRGAGALALMLESAGKLESIVVEEGVLIANVQGLGYGTVTTLGGVLEIVQTDAGTLNASLEGGADDHVSINTHAFITNVGNNSIRVGSGINEGNVGTVQVFRDQHDFYGTLTINNGSTLLLGGEDVFKNAKSILLLKGENSRQSTLTVADIDAKAHNLQGDELSRLQLGRGTLTLIQDETTLFLGEVSGEGSLIKAGAGDLTLAGRNIYGGATVAAAGTLSLVTANAIQNTSALIIKDGARVSMNDTNQVIGALFGESGAVLDIGASTLTIGFSDAVRANLAANSTLLNAGYLATYTTDIKNPGNLNSPAIGTTEQNGTTVGYLKSDPIALNNAGELAYAGEIIGSGKIVKIGTERLTLSGVSEKFTGAVEVQQGILRLSEDSLPNASSIIINTDANSDDDFLEFYVAAGRSISASPNISGSGSLRKVGFGELRLDNYTYEGKTGVDAGRLIVGDIAKLSPVAKEISVNNSGVLVVDWSGAEASVFDGSITGTGGLEKIGSGKVVITETAAYGHKEAALSGEHLIGFNRLDDTVNNSITLESNGTAVKFVDAVYSAIDETVTLQDGTIVSAANLKDFDVVNVDVPVNVSYEGIVDNGDGTYTLADHTVIDTAAPGNLSGFTTSTTAVTFENVTDNGDGTYTLEDGVTVFDPANPGNLANVVVSGTEITADRTDLAAIRTDVRSDVVGTPVGIAIQNSDGSISLLSEEATAAATAVDVGATLRKNGTVLNADGTRRNLHAVVVDANGGAIYLNGVELDSDYLTLNDNTTTVTGEHNGVVIIGPDGLPREVSNGATIVLEGELVLNDLPQFTDTNSGVIYYSDFEVAQGATLNVNIGTADRVLQGDLAGEGTFVKDGENKLTLNGQKADFAGTFVVQKGTVSLEAEEVLANASSIQLKSDAILALNGNKQTFHYLHGDEASTLKLGGADVYFVVDGATGEVEEYSGRIEGPGNIYKQGAGMLTLWRPHTAGNAFASTDNFYVEEGVLQVAPAALGDATVDVSAGAELRFYAKADDGVEINGRKTVEYDNAITGAGIIGKGGAGTVWLKGTGTIPTGDGTRQFAVTEGRLIVDDSRTGGVIPLVEVAKDATFQINLSNAGPILLSEQTVFGEGNFSIKATGGATIVTVDDSPLGYTGLTEIIGSVTLNFDPAALQAGEHYVLNGISGIADGANTPTLDLTGIDLLEINQGANAVFEGAVVGDGASSILLKGEGTLALTGSNGKIDSSIADVTVDGGTLQVGIANTHEVSLNNGGTLVINNNADDYATYAGAIANDTGTFNVSKNGTGSVSIDASFAGNLPANAKIDTLSVSEGTLQLVANAGNLSASIPARNLVTELKDVADLDSTVLELSVASGQVRLDLPLTGTGTFEKTGAGALQFTNQEQFTGLLRIKEGEVNGTFKIGGDMVVANGAILAPGNSIGTVSVGGNFVAEAGSTLALELGSGKDTTFDLQNGVFVSDRVIFNADGTAAAGVPADITGSILKLDGLDGVVPARGAKYAVLVDAGAKSAGGVTAITGTFVDDSSNTIKYVTILPQDNADITNPYYGLGVDYGVTVLVTQDSLSDVNGYESHAGLGELLPVLDGFSHASTSSTVVGDPAARLGALLNATSTDKLGGAVNNLSPLGYSSLVAMMAASGNANVEQLHARMEQRRYDRRLFSDKSWQSYVQGSGNFANNGNGTDDAVYNFNTYGGLLGADNQLSEENLLGVALEYTNGKATLHDGGGHMKMNAVRGTGYLSHMLNEWFFVDAGVSGGYMDYEVKRETLSGQNKGEPAGWTVGAFATLATVFPVSERMHVKPYVGLEYNHYEVDGVEESGSISRLSVSSYDYDSMRAKVGTGFGWFVESGEWEWKFNLDVAYAHELLDTDADLEGEYAEAGGGRFQVSSKTLASDVLQIGPSVTLSLNENSSLYASYRLEVGVDGETYNNINLGFRTRF